MLEYGKVDKEKYEELIKGNKDKKDIEVKYSKKIDFLAGNNFLGEEEYHKLKAFSFDRNRGGHPDLGDIDKKRAKTYLSTGIWIIIDLQKKISPESF